MAHQENTYRFTVSEQEGVLRGRVPAAALQQMGCEHGDAVELTVAGKTITSSRRIPKGGEKRHQLLAQKREQAQTSKAVTKKAATKKAGAKKAAAKKTATKKAGGPLLKPSQKAGAGKRGSKKAIFDNLPNADMVGAGE